jgi:hypothetical protein
MDIIDDLLSIVKVHVVRDDTREVEQKPKAPKETIATYRTFTLSTTLEPQQLLGHAPNRIRATLQFTTAGPVILGASKAQVLAGNSDTAQINVAAAGPFILETTKELWGWSTVAGLTNAAVIAEYEER